MVIPMPVPAMMGVVIGCVFCSVVVCHFDVTGEEVDGECQIPKYK